MGVWNIIMGSLEILRDLNKRHGALGIIGVLSC